MKLNGEERLALRLAKSVRILDDIKAYLRARTAQRAAEEPRRASEQLRVVELESVKLDTARTATWKSTITVPKRSLRGIAVGRRKLDVHGSDNGGRTAAV